MSDEPRAQSKGTPLANETSEEPTQRLEVKVLGRVLGYCSGWDDIDTEVFLFLGFVPNPGVDLAEGHLTVDYGKGEFLYHNLRGDIVDTRDIIAVVERLPRT